MKTVTDSGVQRGALHTTQNTEDPAEYNLDFYTSEDNLAGRDRTVIDKTKGRYELDIFTRREGVWPSGHPGRLIEHEEEYLTVPPSVVDDLIAKGFVPEWMDYDAHDKMRPGEDAHFRVFSCLPSEVGREIRGPQA